MSKENTLVLVDGSSLAFRSFFALFNSGLRTKSGQPTWAILGFFNSLFELIEKFKPQMLAVSFDMAEPTFRHIEFKEYKANRLEMPDDLSKQWPLIKKGVEKLGLPVYELPGYEADDLIGTLARAAEKENFNVLILTGDQDAFQLIDEKDEKIKVLMPGKTGLQIYGRQEVFAKLGVWPEQITDYKGLCGDSSDNIPGIKGIGPKTATQLLSTYIDLENVYKHIGEIQAKGLHSKLVEGEASARQSKQLATIRYDVPLQFDFVHCLLTRPDIVPLQEFFGDLEFKTMSNRLPKVLQSFSTLEPIPEPLISSHITNQIPATIPNLISPSSSPSAPILESTQNNRVINSEVELDDLIEELSKQEVISLYVHTSPLSALSGSSRQTGKSIKRSAGRLVEDLEIGGYAISWGQTLVSASDWPEGVKGAYIPIRQTLLALTGQPMLERQLVNKKLSQIFLEPSIGKIVFNCKHIFNLLAAERLQLNNVIFDPMLASYIGSPDEKHGLFEQAKRILDYQPDSNEGAQSSRTSCDNSYLNLKLAEHYAGITDADQKFLLQKMELPLSVVLAKMQQYGVALNLPYLERLAQELNIEISRLEQQIYNFAGSTFNINSTQQLRKILFQDLALATKTKTKTGFSTDASVLESLKNEHQIIPLLLDYRQLTKLKSTYVDALPKMVSSRDGRLHGEFNQTVTSTGRLSSSNPNLQNIPIRTEFGRRIRKAFIPQKKGWFLLSADYSQIELRFLAHMSGDERLIDAFNKNQDVHARTAGEIFDQPIENVTSEMRRVGKTLNFALIYQQGAYATARDLGISTKEASAFIDKYFRRYAQVKAFMDTIVANARRDGYVETLWKRRRYFKFLHDRNEALRRADEKAACNAPLQGSAADLMKLAMIRLDNELSTAKLQSRLILQVHDELVLEVPEFELNQTKEIVIAAMLMDQPLLVPLKVDVGIGASWIDTK